MDARNLGAQKVVENKLHISDVVIVGLCMRLCGLPNGQYRARTYLHTSLLPNQKPNSS